MNQIYVLVGAIAASIIIFLVWGFSPKCVWIGTESIDLHRCRLRFVVECLLDPTEGCKFCPLTGIILWAETPQTGLYIMRNADDDSRTCTVMCYRPAVDALLKMHHQSAWSFAQAAYDRTQKAKKPKTDDRKVLVRPLQMARL